MNFLKQQPKQNTVKIFKAKKLILAAVLFISTLFPQTLSALPNCEDIAYPNSPIYDTNCNYPGCTSAISRINLTTSNCELPNCTIPLTKDEIPTINCKLPNCPNPISGSAKPETNCSLRTCPVTLGTNDIPFLTCSLPPCSKPDLSPTDIPGLTCSLPICSTPLALGDIPRANCLLPTCPNGVNRSEIDVTCSLKSCSVPLADGEQPEINCSLPVCSLPLSKTDIPGKNCTIRKCHNRTISCSGDLCDAINSETPGVNCSLPDCDDVSDVRPGITCLYKSRVFPDFTPAPDMSTICNGIPLMENIVSGKPMRCLVPICDDNPDRRNHGVNCMNMIDLPVCGNASDPKAVDTSHVDNPRPGKNCISSCNGSAGEKPGINCHLPSCDSNSITGSAIPGQNCLFEVNGAILPLCTGNSDVPIKQHRINCADLIDLPLCSTMSTNAGADGKKVGKPGKNCVKVCADILPPTGSSSGSGPTLTRGVDYAVHNSDCVNFCSASSTTGCVQPSCHQLTGGDIPDGNNCDSIACDLLAPEELNDQKFWDETLYSVKFCEGEAKCYNFTNKQLPFTFIRPQNPTCKKNKCKPNNCIAFDDTVNIKNQDTIPNYLNYLGKTFSEQYLYNFYGNMTLDVGITCEQIICLPKFQRPYHCSPEEDRDASIRNVACDISGSGSNCVNGYCYKTIDCNNRIFSNEPECMVREDATSTTIGTTEDVTNAWFFRPKPNDKSYRGNNPANGFRQMDRTHICYSRGDMGSQPEKKTVQIPFGLFNADTYANNPIWGVDLFLHIPPFINNVPIGYFHTTLAPDDTRSPGMCEGSGTNSATKLGNPGLTIEYLCGNDGNLWSHISEETGYYSGYVESRFFDIGAKHKVRVCYRMKNLARPDDPDIRRDSETCGARECGINCGFGMCLAQNCGFDFCHTLEIDDAKPYDCEIGKSTTESSGSGLAMTSKSKSCAYTEGNFRVRAVKYGRYICGFLDVRGAPAYSGIFFNGGEKIFSGTNHERCVSGNKLPDANGNCHGIDTNGETTLSENWRTAIRIPYIQNNRPLEDPIRGYLDFNGRLHRAQECAKAPMRASPPQTFNLANPINSYRLFMPPLYISKSMTRKGGRISESSDADDLGKTDFHYPEILVQFGTTSKTLSLSINETGYESDPPDSSTATINSGTTPSFESEIFIRKEFNLTQNIPLLCLYNKARGPDGAFTKPIRIQCVERQQPEINGTVEDISGMPTENRRAFISPGPASTFDNPELSIQLISSSKEFYESQKTACASIKTSCFASCSDIECKKDCLKIENECVNDCKKSGNQCTEEITLQNDNLESPFCNRDLEKHNLCAQRDPCTIITNECMVNEISLHQAKKNGDPYLPLQSFSEKCSEELIPRCNKKFGYDSPENVSIYDYQTITPNPNAYGWFNEICIVSGFENKLRTVIARKLDGIQGKCRIDVINSPNMKSGGIGCDEGGKAPGCLCAEYVEGITNIGADEEFRKETPHEAGLCVEIPRAKTCPAINFEITPNPLDPHYINSSLGLGKKYCNDPDADPDNCIHISHKRRKHNINPLNGKAHEIFAHAEFPQSIAGMSGIQGECSGFWTNSSVNNSEVTPSANCELDSSGKAVWTGDINHCVRYSCPAVSVKPNGIDIFGKYDDGFVATGESDDEMGSWNGFATWNSYQKTDDFNEIAVARDCIPGFKKNGGYQAISSSAYSNLISSNPALEEYMDPEITSTKKPFLALFKMISGLNGGVLPTRYCNQIGLFSSVENKCERVSCSALTPPTPKDSDDVGAWILWEMSGGASFPETKASRSKTFAENNSKAIGTCNESLGFFRMPGAPEPNMECDYRGNWKNLKNRCVSSCKEIKCDSSNSLNLANSIDNGFACWNKADIGDLDEVDGEFVQCIAGYYPNPYPPTKDKYGNDLDPAIANDISRPALGPIRICKAVVPDGALPTDPKREAWGVVVSPCINSCPGAQEDSRIGVGVTEGYIYSPYDNSLTKETLSWPETKFGEWATIYVPAGQNSGNYTIPTGEQYRSNSHYIVRRYCNPTTHKWEDHRAECVINGGRVSNAIMPGYDFLKTIYGSETIQAESCALGYDPDPALPEFKCMQALVTHAGQTIKPINQTYLLRSSTAKCSYRPAEGGDIIRDLPGDTENPNGYVVHIFNNPDNNGSASLRVYAPYIRNVEYLVAGGGGGGGYSRSFFSGGGGGGGGQVIKGDMDMISRGTHAVTVGRGGEGGKNVDSSYYCNHGGAPSVYYGNNGENSSFYSINANGGGGGGGASGGQQGDPFDAYPGYGKNGASGGGSTGTNYAIGFGRRWNGDPIVPGGQGTSGKGHNGASCGKHMLWNDLCYGAGGGGGSQANGQQPSWDGSSGHSGDGGLGSSYDISGQSVMYGYGGGGGGGSWKDNCSYYFSEGNSGSGNNYGKGGRPGCNYSDSGHPDQGGNSAENGTGGGGGGAGSCGGGWFSGSRKGGGDGGHGTVIIKYPVPNDL